MKSCLHVYFSSLGPGHPSLKELCFKLFHFESLSFGFYSFCFISSQVTSQASLKGLFFFFCDFDYNDFYFFQHLSLNLEILMPKIMIVFPLILNHLVLQDQIIDILFSSPISFL